MTSRRTIPEADDDDEVVPIEKKRERDYVQRALDVVRKATEHHEADKDE